MIIFTGNFRTNLREKIKMWRMCPEVAVEKELELRPRLPAERIDADKDSRLSPQVLQDPF